MAKTTVTEKDCVITITLNIQISGATATQAVADKIKKEIEDCYNGQNFKYDCCTVKFVVNTKVGGAADPNYHQIKIHKEPGGNKYRDSVNNPLPKPNGSSGSGNWGDSNPKGTYAHEAGHLMGLKDRYKSKKVGGKRTTKPCKGHENDKMAKHAGKPQQSDINSVIEAAGVKCPDSCKAGKAKSSDSGSKDTAHVTLPNTGEFVVVALSPQAEVSTTVTLPADLGGGEVFVGPFAGSMTVLVDGPPDAELNPFLDPNVGSMQVLEFDFVGPPVVLPNGDVTSDVILSLNTADTMTSLGAMNMETGAYTLDIQGFLDTSLDGQPMTMPFESRITGQYDAATGFTDFQCETLIVTDANPDTEVPTACDADEVPPIRTIRGDVSADRNGDGVLDACQTADVLRFYHGTPAGGGLRAVISGFGGACALEVPTFAGDTALGVQARFAAAVVGNDCMRRQGITAHAAEGVLTLSGPGLTLEDEIYDPGLQRLRSNVPLYLPPKE
jgi:hypothetical protein